MAREVYLVGVGMGNPATLTVEAQEAIARGGLLVGAARMLEPYGNSGKRLLSLVAADDIVRALVDADEPAACVLFSGDVGFYSGAPAVAAKLADVPGMEVHAIPGVSSLSYLCARLLVPWHDAFAVSAHGRECDAVAAVKGHAKTFLLVGGATSPQDVCRELVQAGLGGVTVHVGERLSHADERLASGTATELAGYSFDDLSALLVLNPQAPAFEPGKVVAR